MLKIRDSSQITGNTNNFVGFTDTHVVSRLIQGFMPMYETSKCPAILGDSDNNRQSETADETGNTYISETVKVQ